MNHPRRRHSHLLHPGVDGRPDRGLSASGVRPSRSLAFSPPIARVPTRTPKCLPAGHISQMLGEVVHTYLQESSPGVLSAKRLMSYGFYDVV